jgi:hypothetical protein
LDRGPVAAFTSLQPQGINSTLVKSFSIDDLLGTNEIQEVQFIKLDVEGAELRALNGAKSMVQKAKPRICIEAWDKESYEQTNALLSTFGYKSHVFDSLGNLDTFSTFYPSSNVFFLC